jgi:pimeloyl-ACP methyl ester carboxylesterase
MLRVTARVATLAAVPEESLRFDKVRLATGPRLHYAEQGDRRGEAIVFLHGWPDSWFSFSRVLPLLPPDLRLLAIDQRGYGESDRRESGYGIPDLAGDVLAFLDALEIDRATLVGHSFGTFVARCVAISQPRRVARLVLIGTGFTDSHPILQNLPAAMRDLPEPVPVDFAREFQAGTIYRPVPTEFFDQIVAESLKLPARLWRALIDGLMQYADETQLGTIAAPTLLLWGDHDALFSRAHQDRYLAASPHAKLTVYEETGHCPNWEQPERVAADIQAFL